MASEPQLRLSWSEVSWCSRRDPPPHGHLPEPLISPASAGLPAVAHREEAPPVPHDTNLCLILPEMVRGGETLAQGWAPHGQVKNPSTDIIPAWSLCMSCAVAAQLKKHLVLTHRRVRKEQRGKQAKSFPALSIRQGPGLVEGNFWTNYLLSMKQHLFLL